MCIFNVEQLKKSNLFELSKVLVVFTAWSGNKILSFENPRLSEHSEKEQVGIFKEISKLSEALKLLKAVRRSQQINIYQIAIYQIVSTG